MHVVPQGEGGEQGDAMMPLLFCLGQQKALRAVQQQLEDGERLFAFLDDVYVVIRPERVGEVYRQDFGGSLEGFLVHPHPQRQNEDMEQVLNASRGMRLVGADCTRREPQSQCVEGRWGVHRPARQQGAGHSTWARRFLRQSPPRSRARPTRASEKDPDDDRSAVRVVDVVALRRGKSQLTAQIRQTFSYRTIRKNPRRRYFAVSGHHPWHRSGSMHRSCARVGDSSTPVGRHGFHQCDTY